MVVKWSFWRWRKIGGIESGFVCAAMAATGLAIWKKEESLKDNSLIPTQTQAQLVQFPEKNKSFNISSVANSNITSCSSKLQDTIAKASILCERVKDEHGLPGLVVAVSVNGQRVWETGFGYADIENRVPMKPEAVLRIASISKSMTMAMMGKLIEDGKINLDCPIQTYLPNFPKKSVDGEAVTITTRQLLSHMSGIRHYTKKGEKIEEGDDSKFKEFFLKRGCETVDQAFQIFQDDELHHKPGSKYLYTTHGYTVVSAIIEKLTEKPFAKYAQKMFDYWGLKNTYLDEHEKLIYHRARYYSRNKRGHLVNSPWVDNSCKWAGGGFQSNVIDLVRFANILMASYQYEDNASSSSREGNEIQNKPYLKRATIQQLWTKEPKASADPDSDFRYGMGFQIATPLRKCLFGKEIELMTVLHGGGAVGSSSILYMAFPKDFRFSEGHDEVDGRVRQVTLTNDSSKEQIKTKGLAIAMITNLTSVSLSSTAKEIAELFKWMM